MSNRIGIFGGSFNPPHVGHLLIAEFIRDNQELDSVVWIPAYQPPHKLGRTILSSQHRTAMLERALDGNPLFEISELELSRGGVSYTLHTLEEFRSGLPHANIFLIMGSDSYADLESWHRPDEILELAELIVYPRRGTPSRPRGGFPATFVDAPIISISSTEIRRRVHQGRSIRYFVSDSVRDYIESHGLYLDGAN
jgi:nicotinate-nucleotide adenylyltransferase